MEEKPPLLPAKTANKINRILDSVHKAHGGNRFPINLDELILGAAEIFQWSDPITTIKTADISNFEGMLSSNDDSSKWMIVYNSSLSSLGRINFTKAHELGHYILHRDRQNTFSCSRNDMLEWSKENNIESQADMFASYLLMPLNDFRIQADGLLNLDTLSHCADRYGVSLTAAILKWLSYTNEKAVLIMSNDGYMNWASSSPQAYKSGAFFKTRNNVIPLPESSLAINNSINSDISGTKLAAKIWFPHCDSDSSLTEMKIYSKQYDCTLSLIILPKYSDYWPPKT